MKTIENSKKSQIVLWEQGVVGSNPVTPTTLTLSVIINPQILWICGFFVLFHIIIRQYISM